MKAAETMRPTSVIGPLGQPLTLASLPPTSTKRWIAHRKAELVAAVDGGLLSIEDVCERYGIDIEEFDIFGLLQDVVANKAQYGFDVVNTACVTPNVGRLPATPALSCPV